MTQAPLPLVDLIGSLIENEVTEDTLETLQAIEGANINKINYLYGPIAQIRETLKQYDESPTERFNKYPLFVLITPFPESMGEGSRYYAKTTVQIGIAFCTERDNKSSDNYSKYIKTVLLPLYEALLDAIEYSEFFVCHSRNDIKHKRVIRDDIAQNPFMKIDGATYDYIVAIELQDLELTVNYENALVDISKIYGKN